MRILIIFVLVLTASPVLAQDGAPAATLMFHGFACPSDCSGHRAGFDWAAENEITTEDGCSNDAQDFTEGCIAWVRSLSEEYGDEGESDEEYYEDSAAPADPVSP